ncbi:secretin N-terminal domain-containing protein [Azonexus sp.]|jgi:general secretion pathway protein D|uniref:secretin N-terminal domain-containing protein n=1 Tax=Azonexus sp. TaxID=1872668 RepID=UPI00282E6AB2|nr:secretin N-terminal domain-containing protein [Azonexus sp.]MDR1996293.1 secretin N-terminal domain-containing protein [Azonexus sp.]
MKIGYFSATIIPLLLAACVAPTPREPLAGHLRTETTGPASTVPIPAPVQQTLALPAPRPQVKAETYSVVVNNVPVHDLLFALARDAKVNVDIHPGITGVVSLNAIDQTLPQILSRIARQVDMRFELDGPNLAVMPDSPFLKHYQVDYVNMSRSITATVSTNTQIATGVGGNTGTMVGGSGGNVSTTQIENSSKNRFWESLEKNIQDLLRETDKILPDGSSETFVEQTAEQAASGTAALPQAAGRGTARAIANALQTHAAPTTNSQRTDTAVYRTSTFREAASVIINAETGVVTVRATQRQHDRIQEFLDRVSNSARRQVLIEATIVEVTLNDGYQQGINWTGLVRSGTFAFIGDAMTPNAVNLSFTRGNDPNFDPKALVTLFNTFGTTRVLSSPRLSVMNNQTALLKVVDNYVYFNVKADTTMAANVSGVTTYTTTPQSVSVGLVISVTPQISNGDAITLNVRPTITSIAGEVDDPNPSLLNSTPPIRNKVPIIRTKEIESIMRVASGNIAVLGGLMEDKIDYQNQRVPVVGQIPLVGELFNNRNNQAQKTELVILLRPVVIRDPSIDGDFAGLRAHVPGDDFFAQPNEAQPFNIRPSR